MVGRGTREITAIGLLSAALFGCGDDSTGGGSETSGATTEATTTTDGTTSSTTATTTTSTTDSGSATAEVTTDTTTTSSTTTTTTTTETTTAGTTETTGPAPFCGDGVVDDGEACDDGNDVDTDACTSACALASCGDGFVGPGEACDDGNQVDDDACTNACALASCGDGVIQDGEACDDGNDVDTDECLGTCLSASCGDGVVHEGIEECDDANVDDVDTCSNACALATCDDAVKNAAETDVDCGGEACESCGLGQGCEEDDDCGAGLCSAGICALAVSCAALHEAAPMLADGIYDLDPDGEGPILPFAAYCDMTTSGGGWTLVARVNGADAHTVLYDTWTAGVTVGAVDDFSLVAGGDVLYPAHLHVDADALMFYDATAPCGGDHRLLESGGILEQTNLHDFLAGIPPLNVTYYNADPALGANVSIAAFLNKGCVHPLYGSANKFPMDKFGVNISMTTHNPNAFVRFTTSPNDWDVGVASKLSHDGGYQCGDLDPLGDAHNGWAGHVVTVFVR